MAAIGYRSLAILLLLTITLAAAAAKKKKGKLESTLIPRDNTTASLETKTTVVSTTELPSTLPPNPCKTNKGGCTHTCNYNKRTKIVTCSCRDGFNLGPDRKTCFIGCRTAHCSHGCAERKGANAVCSCPDERMILNKDGQTCSAKSCRGANKYTCGANAKCTRNWDGKERGYMPVCKCSGLFFWSTKYVLDPKTRSCRRDTRYHTCDWPTKAGCDQTCSVKSNSKGDGTHPECSCTSGYKLDSNGKNCIVTNPCLVDSKNGGCDHACQYNRQTLVVQCSCHSDSYTLKADGRGCLRRSCSNGNSGCAQSCVQMGDKDYYCTCDKGFHLNPDKKTCLDYDECSGFHGCDQMCVPDGNHYYKCQCGAGYELDSNGFSCRVTLKCVNHGCSQHCNPTTGACYCDAGYQLDSDGKTCVDVDECATNRDNCAELCTNTDGGFTCSCRDARARLSNDLKTCILDTCQELVDIKYGKTSCVHGHGDTGTMKIGDYCTFSCIPGTKLVGSSTVYCTKTGYDVTPPHCADINECENKLACSATEDCANSLGSYYCHCKPGYIKENGVCVDTSVPQVTFCPPDATVNLPADSDSVRFTWAKPQVWDPTDAKLSCINCPSSQERVLKVGQVAIRYLYSDDAGNKALCSFKVKVVDVTPPKFSNCPDGKVFTRVPGIYTIEEFAKVTATDNSGSVTVTNDKPPLFKNPGLRTVNYIAKDESGNHATCIFYVNITITECPELIPPTNGYHGCADWHIGSFCSPKCNEGYAFYMTPVLDRHCGDDGQWMPAEPIPACLKTVQPTEASIMYVSRYDITKNKGKCPNDDPAAKKQVIQMTRANFDGAKSSFCFIGDSCELVSDPEITCDAVHIGVTLLSNEDYSKVPKHGDMLLEFKKKIRSELTRNDAFMSLFIPPITILHPLVDKNGLPITPQFSLNCPAKSQKRDNVCVTCPATGC